MRRLQTSGAAAFTRPSRVLSLFFNGEPGIPLNHAEQLDSLSRGMRYPDDQSFYEGYGEKVRIKIVVRITNHLPPDPLPNIVLHPVTELPAVLPAEAVQTRQAWYTFLHHPGADRAPGRRGR